MITQTCALRTRAHVRVYFLSIYISPSYIFDFFSFFRSFEVEWGLRKGRIVEILPAGISTIAFFSFVYCILLEIWLASIFFLAV